jgi:uncharacterized RDD family membrane protein YckC
MSIENDDDPNPYQSPLTASERIVPGSALPLASRLSRLGAILIDGIISIVISLPVMFFTGYIQRTMQNNVAPSEIIYMTIFGIVLFIGIHGYLLASRGQTVGKMLAGIKIVDHRTDDLLPIGKLIGLRYLPIWIISIIPFVGIILVWVDALFIFGRNRRCVHDYIAGTKVIVRA